MIIATGYLAWYEEVVTDSTLDQPVRMHAESVVAWASDGRGNIQGYVLRPPDVGEDAFQDALPRDTLVAAGILRPVVGDRTFAFSHFDQE